RAQQRAAPARCGAGLVRCGGARRRRIPRRAHDARPEGGQPPSRLRVAVRAGRNRGTRPRSRRVQIAVLYAGRMFEEGTDRMGLLTFSINVTLDGCVDHQEGIADEETHAHFTRLMDECGAMLWVRTTYEMMESYWPAVARGDVDAPPAMREWALKL